ncbi:hypothetical protein EfmAA818_27880 [Enterococcus faecium]|nr:hypothetical protein EfmAA818_27880 [Enterococcus faecium]
MKSLIFEASKRTTPSIFITGKLYTRIHLSKVLLSFVNVNGGGYAGQSGAIRHGIARALLEVDPDFRLALKRAGLLTRDARMVERKNQVLKKLVWHFVVPEQKKSLSSCR